MEYLQSVILPILDKVTGTQDLLEQIIVLILFIIPVMIGIVYFGYLMFRRVLKTLVARMRAKQAKVNRIIRVILMPVAIIIGMITGAVKGGVNAAKKWYNY